MRRVSVAIVSCFLLVSACGGGGGSSSGGQAFNDSIASDLSNLIVHDVSAGDHTVLHISADTNADFDLEVVVLADISYVQSGSSSIGHGAAPPLDSFFTDASIDSDIAAGRTFFAVGKQGQHVKLAVPVVTKGSFRIVVGGDNGEGGAVTVRVDTEKVNGSDDDVRRSASESNSSR